MVCSFFRGPPNLIDAHIPLFAFCFIWIPRVNLTKPKSKFQPTAALPISFILPSILYNSYMDHLENLIPMWSVRHISPYLKTKTNQTNRGLNIHTYASIQLGMVHSTCQTKTQKNMRTMVFLVRLVGDSTSKER